MSSYLHRDTLRCASAHQIPHCRPAKVVSEFTGEPGILTSPAPRLIEREEPLAVFIDARVLCTFRLAVGDVCFYVRSLDVMRSLAAEERAQMAPCTPFNVICGLLAIYFVVSQHYLGEVVKCHTLSSGTIGNDSCNGDRACYCNTAAIGPGQCNGAPIAGVDVCEGAPCDD